jgi:hypothetical protein
MGVVTSIATAVVVVLMAIKAAEARVLGALEEQRAPLDVGSTWLTAAGGSAPPAPPRRPAGRPG